MRDWLREADALADVSCEGLWDAVWIGDGDTLIVTDAVAVCGKVGVMLFDAVTV